MGGDFARFFAALLRTGGTGYAYGPVQYGKTANMLEAAAMARAEGYTPIIVTQPDLRLRDQGHDDAIRAAKPSPLGRGLDLGLDLMRGSPHLYEEVIHNTFVTHSLIFDIMHVRRARDFTSALDKLQRNNPEHYDAGVAGKIVLIQDEADLFLDDLGLLAEAAPTEKERRRLIASIAQIETTLDRLVRDSHVVLKVSATICTNMLAAIKQGKAPPPEAIYVAPATDTNYQGVGNFEHRSISPIAGTYDFRVDADLLRFVDAVLLRADEPVALINVHRHTAHHNQIKRELEQYIKQHHAALARDCKVIEVNNTTSREQNRSSVANLIADAHLEGRKFIFVVGGKKLDRGIRCASSNVFGTGTRPGDGRYATDHFMRPPTKLVLPALQQQMRLSGRYPGGKPRILWMPDDNYEALIGYTQVQGKMLAELQKPVAHRADLIPLSQALERYLGSGMALLMSERHKRLVGNVVGDTFALFKTAVDALDFCKKQGFQVVVQSDILWMDDLAGLDPRARETIVKGELTRRLGRNPRLRVLAKSTKARGQGRRWRSNGDCIDLGQQTIGQRTGEAVLITYMKANDADARAGDAEVRVELDEDNTVTGFRVDTRIKHLKLVA